MSIAQIVVDTKRLQHSNPLTHFCSPPMKLLRLTLTPIIIVLSTMLALQSKAQTVASDALPAVASARADLGDFKIDVTEVSIGRFAGYAARNKIVTAAERDGGGFEYVMGWQRRSGWNWRMPFGKVAEAHEPAVHLTWAEAQGFCQDAGGRLPTKAQWQRAAYTEQRAQPPAGFEKGKTYPYPTGESPEGANVEGAADGWARHAPVGQTRIGVNGLYDMGANVWEWLADAQDGQYLTAGGSWWYGPSTMKAEAMQYKRAELYVVYVGFRCVY